jgi:hypothetical protein
MEDNEYNSVKADRLNPASARVCCCIFLMMARSRQIRYFLSGSRCMLVAIDPDLPGLLNQEVSAIFIRTGIIQLPYLCTGNDLFF